MYILLILFFISLALILSMMGHKLRLVRDGQIMSHESSPYFIPDLEIIREVSVRGLKKYGHLGLVGLVRMQIKSVNMTKKSYGMLKEKLSNIEMLQNSKWRGLGDEAREVKVSKFLKMVSDYKQKVREIRHRIHEEEKN